MSCWLQKQHQQTHHIEKHYVVQLIFRHPLRFKFLSISPCNPLWSNTITIAWGWYGIKKLYNMIQKIFSPHFRATRRINSYVPSPLNSPAAARRLTQKLGNHLTPTSMRKKRSSPPHEAAQQVWSLTQFFLFPFFCKSFVFSWRANQWFLIRELLFSSVPRSNSLVPVSDPWRAFLS